MTQVFELSFRSFARSLAIVAIVFSCASSLVAQDEATPGDSPAAAVPAEPAALEGDGIEGNGPAEAGGKPEPGVSFRSMLPLYLGLFLLWYLIVLRPSSSQKAKRKDLLSNLKKNDKVITTGGIVGTVANVHENTGEVTIRSGDTPIRVLRESIREVIDDSTKEAEKAT